MPPGAYAMFGDDSAVVPKVELSWCLAAAGRSRGLGPAGFVDTKPAGRILKVSTGSAALAPPAHCDRAGARRRGQ